jgi:small GTP-binding protein
MTTNLLDDIIQIASEQHFDDILLQAQSLQNMQNGDDFVEVVVLGQFKAGKSSLINSFLKEPVLPVGVLPVTAVITRLSYGPEKKASVTFLDGKKLEIEPEQIRGFITEKDNPENTKQVSLVDIELPELTRFKNIRFVDTPGLGSVYTHNTEATQKWFKNIGAAIVVISVTQPLSENDMELIRSAKEQSPEVRIVLSKTDLLRETELQDMENFIEEKSRQVFGQSFTVYPYSVIQNTRTFSHAIIKDVFKKLSSKARETNRRIFEHKLQYLRHLTKSYLEIQLQLQNKQEEEREALKDQIIDQQLKLDYIKRELSYITEDYKSAARQKLEELIIDKYQNVLILRLSEELDEKYNNWKGHLGKVSGKYEAWIKEAMATAMLDVDRSERKDMQQFLNEACKHFNHYLGGFRERLNQNMQKVLGVSMPDDQFEVEVKLMEKANISVSWAFESHIDLLWFLIPMPLFRNTIKKYFLKQIPLEVEKNLHRLVSLLTVNMQKEIDKLFVQSVSYVTTELEKINQLLNNLPAGSRTIKEQLLQLGHD